MFLGPGFRLMSGLETSTMFLVSKHGYNDTILPKFLQGSHWIDKFWLFFREIVSV